MHKANDAYRLTALPLEDTVSLSRRTYLAAFCLFWTGIALLELGQDYLGAHLYAQPFVLADALAYKLFWLLFIPLLVLLHHALGRARRALSAGPFAGAAAALIATTTLLHLLLFALSLFGASSLLHEHPWGLLQLIYEKLSTRLYLALAVYSTLPSLQYYLRKRKQNASTADKPTTLAVKNGRRSVLVDLDDIRWIESDGAYLDIHTGGTTHVILDSLKHIITTLPPNFRRIHRSTIVNIDHIRELQSRGNGDYDVHLHSNEVLRLSRNYAPPLRGVLL